MDYNIQSFHNLTIFSLFNRRGIVCLDTHPHVMMWSTLPRVIKQPPSINYLRVGLFFPILDEMNNWLRVEQFSFVCGLTIN